MMCNHLVSRWLVGNILRGTLLVGAVFGGLLLFFDFLDALDRLGQPGWTAFRVLGYALLLQPGRWVEMAPVALLVGTLVALAQLARHSELAVLRTVGLSPYRLWRLVAIAALAVAAATMALAEWVVPVTERLARQWDEGIGVDAAQRSPRRGLWVRDGDRFVHIGAVRDAQTIGDVWWYRLEPGDKPRLQAIDHAPEGIYDAAQEGWYFPEVERRTFQDDAVRQETLRDHFWRSELTPETLAVLWVEPQRMRLDVLYRYIQFLQKNGGESKPFEAAFWRKVLLPLLLVVMATLAVPFVMGHGRTVQLGWRVFAGTMLGVAFFLLTQLSDRIVAVWGVSPFVSALLPLLFFAFLAIALWWRIEQR